MRTDYWTAVKQRRLTRRRALGVTLGTMAGAALTQACGGSSNNTSGTSSSAGGNGGGGSSNNTSGTSSAGGNGGGSSGKTSGLVTTPIDTSAQATRGGVWLDMQNADIQTFDPHFMSIASVQLTEMAYSRLFRTEVGKLKAAVFGSVSPDAVESYEFSGDKLQFTVKLRQNLKWHSLAPVNGRPLDAQDVVFTYERLSQIGTQRAFYVGSLGGPIDSVSAPDSNTIVFKLNQVYAPLLAIFSTAANGNFYIVPREAEDQNSLDLRHTQVGTGPWMLTKYEPSVGLTYARHDGWYAPDSLYVDQLQLPIISEYSNALAQFKAGHIYKTGWGFALHNEDLLPTKAENSALNAYLGRVTSSTGFGFFGWNPALGPKTPFRDIRLRQALSMSWDRDLWIDTFFNTGKLQAQGIPMEVLWNTACNIAWEGWWMDPKGKDFGPNAKYFERNVADAKKLVSAAGFPNGIDVDVHHITTNEYGTDFPQQVETYKAFASDVGIRMNSVIAGYSTDWRPLADSKGDFSGVAFRGAGGNNAPDIPETMVRLMHPVYGGVTYTGFFSPDSSYQKGDPEITALLDKTRSEFDTPKRVALINDVQRLHAERQYVMRVPGGTNSISLAWPAVQNENVFLDELRYVGEWLDPTKPPLT